MSILDPAVVLAFLELGPQDSAQLAALLALPPAVVHQGLLGMQREGTVKRVGSAQRWALPSLVVPAGRKPTVDRAACQAAIRRVLAGTALGTTDLVLRTGFTRNVIKHECARLFQAGQLAHVGIGRAGRWCLPGCTRPPDPTPPPVTPVRVPQSSRTPSPVARRPPTAVDDGLSWWTRFADPALPRDAFTTAARARDAEMCETSAAWRRQSVPAAATHNRPQPLLKGILR